MKNPRRRIGGDFSHREFSRNFIYIGRLLTILLTIHFAQKRTKTQLFATESKIPKWPESRINTKRPAFLRASSNGGMDGTRTRDLLRDKQAF